MRKAFSFYRSHYDQMKLMNDKQKAQLMTAICEVQFLEKNISDIKFSDALLNIVWVGIVHSIETSLKGYVSKQKSLNNDVTIPLEGCQEKDMNPLEQEEEKEEEEGKGKGQLVTGFKKPTASEINQRIQEMNYHLDAETFYNYYESNGWKVGKNKMKSWTSALANWNKTQKQRPQQQNMSFKQKDAQKTETSLDAYFRAKEQGLDLRKPNCGMPLNDVYEEVEVIENVK